MVGIRDAETLLDSLTRLGVSPLLSAPSLSCPMRFQDWYVTGTNGMHTIRYSYRGGIRIEDLTIMNTGAPKTVDPDTDDTTQQVPAASASLYWVVDGIQENSPTDGYSPIDNEAAEGDCDGRPRRPSPAISSILDLQDAPLIIHPAIS